MSDKYTDREAASIKREMMVLSLICIIVFLLSTLQVQDILSIWNQNDEFGTWQGGAWIMGLDWSEVASANNFYGYGYGFILAFFLYFFGRDTVLMTQAAIYFQALMHTGCIFIAWYCIRKMFPAANAVVRVIGASVCILTIPDLVYVYLFFSESLLRFVVWITFGLVVSYAYSRKWYKLLLINMIAIWGFSIHQRCILLVGMAVLLFVYEAGGYVYKNRLKSKTFFLFLAMTAVIVLFYAMEYKYAQQAYISAFYSADGTSDVGGNLLSERGYTIGSILRNIVFNVETEQIAVQNMFGMIYYICASDCGFAFYGFILCLSKMRKGILSDEKNFVLPYGYMGSMALLGVLLVVYQNANGGVYERVEMMHYGRYCSYLLAPMVMMGIAMVLTEESVRVRKRALVVMIMFLVSGTVTYSVLKSHNVTNLFAFANACPGIRSVYYTEDPFTATLYHTVIGILWILVPVSILIWSSKYVYGKKQYIQITVFVLVSVVWIYIANHEWQEMHEGQNAYVTQTYDLQNILQNVDEFAAFKSFGRYGSGLLQYNNVFSKLYIVQSLDEFGEDEDGLLVVSQKGIEEMDDIIQKYDVEYENERYFVWRYVVGK